MFHSISENSTDRPTADDTKHNNIKKLPRFYATGVLGAQEWAAVLRLLLYRCKKDFCSVRPACLAGGLYVLPVFYSVFFFIFKNLMVDIRER